LSASWKFYGRIGPSCSSPTQALRNLHPRVLARADYYVHELAAGTVCARPHRLQALLRKTQRCDPPAPPSSCDLEQSDTSHARLSSFLECLCLMPECGQYATGDCAGLRRRATSPSAAPVSSPRPPLRIRRPAAPTITPHHRHVATPPAPRCRTLVHASSYLDQPLPRPAPLD